MALNKSEDGQLCKLELDGDITIYTIDDLKTKLSNELNSYKMFEMNLAKIEEIDSSGIQLLLAFSRELAHKNKAFKITKASTEAAKLIDSYNLSERLNYSKN